MFGRVINAVDHDFLYLDQDASLNILLMKISHVSLSLFCIIEFTVFYLASLVIKFFFSQYGVQFCSSQVPAYDQLIPSILIL